MSFRDHSCDSGETANELVRFAFDGKNGVVVQRVRNGDRAFESDSELPFIASEALGILRVGCDMCFDVEV
jgi:hypothetical protein